MAAAAHWISSPLRDLSETNTPAMSPLKEGSPGQLLLPTNVLATDLSAKGSEQEALAASMPLTSSRTEPSAAS